MRMRKLLCLGLAAVLVCAGLPTMGTQAQEIQTRQQETREVTSGNGESEDVFQIEDGVLVAYTGEGGDVVIPEGVTAIGEYAFSGCSNLTSVKIPEGVTEIQYSAFSGCSSLASVTIPEGVTYIGVYAFSDCSGLKSITIPKSVSNVREAAFSACETLSLIVVEEGNETYDSRDGCNAIIRTEDDDLIVGCKNTTIPDGVKSIGSEAFSGCVGLEVLTIPGSVTDISYGAFSGCTSLVSVTLPQSIKDIGSYAFCRTDNLKDVYYNGTKEQWADIRIENRNLGLANATIHCTDGDTAYIAPEKEYAYDVSDIVKAEFVKARDIFAGFDDYTYGIGVNLTMSDGKNVYIDWEHGYNEDYEGNAGKYMLNSLSDTLNEIYINSDNGGDEYIKFSVDKDSLDENGHIKTPGNFTVNILISDNFKFSYNKSLQMKAIENPVTGLETIHPSTRKISLSDLQSDMDIIDRTDIVVNYADSTKAPLWGTLWNEEYGNGGWSDTSGWAYSGGSSSYFVCCSRLYPENSIFPVLNIHGMDRYRVEYVLGKDPEELVAGQTYPLIIKYMGQEVTTYIAVTENETENFAYDPDNDDNNTHTHTPGNAVQENIQAASCVAIGSYDEVVYCSECGQEISRQSKVIPATGHKYTKTTKNPTCTAKGVTTYTCSVCKHSYQETIPAAGHKYRKVTKNPTCTAKGAVTCTCSVCRHSYTERTIPATGHKYVTTTVAATIGKNGVVTTTCKVCKKKSQTIIYAPKTVALSKTEGVYNGKQQKPKVTVKDSKGKNLRKGKDYTVTYQKDMKKVGKHMVTVNFKGNYRGTAKMYLAINPRGTSISKATPAEKGFDLKWKKQAKEISGYEAAYSTSNKFTPKSTKVVTAGKGKTSMSVTGLKAKKKYYVRIRTYKTAKGKKYYSDWSKVKSVKIKK